MCRTINKKSEKEALSSLNDSNNQEEVEALDDGIFHGLDFDEEADDGDSIIPDRDSDDSDEIDSLLDEDISSSHIGPGTSSSSTSDNYGRGSEPPSQEERVQEELRNAMLREALGLSK